MLKSGTSNPQLSNCSASHSLANISQSHSPNPTLSLMINCFCSSSVRSSASTIGTSFSPASLQALRRILPPKTIMSLLTTIGLISSILGNSLIDFTSFANLSSFKILGLLGLFLISFIFTTCIGICFNAS